MYGWRAKIGVLVPAPNIVAEPEFNKMVPEGFSVHAARVVRPQVEGAEAIMQAVGDYAKDLTRAASEVARVKPNIIVWACTAGSFIKGAGYDKELISMVEAETDISTITTSTAVVEALQELKVKSLVMVTPYIEEVTQREKQFLEDTIPGLRVVSMKYLAVAGPLGSGVLYPSSAYMAAKEANKPEGDAVFISCTNWRSIDIIEQLESDVRKPVVTSNQATMWAILKRLGHSGIPGYGRLMSTL